MQHIESQLFVDESNQVSKSSVKAPDNSGALVGPNLIEVWFDGGCRPTNPGNKYGSFEVRLDGSLIFKASRFELGHGTNNEAEFESLIKALDWTLENLINGGFDSRIYSVQIYTDSTVVRNRVNGSNKKRKTEPEKRMYDLAHHARMRLWQFQAYAVAWQGRQNNVKRFGH